MKITQVRQQKVKKLQLELARKLQKQKWFADREKSIEQESLKLEEESRQARALGDIRRVRIIEEFQISLAEAHRAMGSRKLEMAADILLLQAALEEALKERKVVEKLEELHYNRRLQKRRKQGEG